MRVEGRKYRYVVPRVACGTLSSIRRCPALKYATGRYRHAAFVSQLSIIAATAAMAFVGAIVRGVL